MELWLMRHAPTEWNERRIFLGSTDLPLSETGRNSVKEWRLPAGMNPELIFASPLLRARQTAAALFPGREIHLDARLQEMALGDWEGRSYEEVKKLLSAEDRDREWRGLDFASHGGESLRQVMARLHEWLQELLAGEGKGPVLAISHKMAITAFYALASGWDANARPAERLRFPRLHGFRVDETGKLSVLQLNREFAMKERPAE